MKTVSIGMALLMGLSVAQAGDKPVLTYEKIGYIAQNCASSSGFAAWLENKPGITKVTQSFIHLTSLPSKSNVFFTMQGRKYSVREPRFICAGRGRIDCFKKRLTQSYLQKI
ncbi:MAG: hypothetical protein IPG66_01640 [Hydrogenophilales bacterium]|nr:hypothetical protein [Hydrogenophilales bacterium]